MSNRATQKVILLTSVADVIKYFKGEIPDWDKFITEHCKLKDDIRVVKETYLRAIELMEIAKHIS